jgi:hypothetical protein
MEFCLEEDTKVDTKNMTLIPQARPHIRWSRHSRLRKINYIASTHHASNFNNAL